ncbi:ATP-binding cassette domain-containing protein [Telluria sp. Tellsp104]
MLRFDDVSKSYGSRPVLQRRTGRFAPGAYALRGPNGIGKSTLLRVLAGVDEADGGDIVIDGHSLRAQPAAAKARLAYAPDECPVYPFVTGRELLAFVAWAKGCAIPDKVTRIVERFGLARHLDTRCGAMSLGTQKKLMLAAAWIGEPAVLLLDEPSNGLDADARAVLADLLAAQRDTSVVFMSTHDKAFADAIGAAEIEFETLTDH